MEQPQRFRLLFVGGSIGLSMLLTYLFGLMIGLTLFICAYIGFIFYVRKRQPGTFSLGLNDSDPDKSRKKHANSSISGGGIKPTYICLSCGRKVSGRVCRKCGSHMKKAVF